MRVEALRRGADTSRVDSEEKGVNTERVAKAVVSHSFQSDCCLHLALECERHTVFLEKD